MSERYKVGETERPHFITITVIDWVDVFTRPVYKELLVNSLNHCIAHKSLKVYAYCIMPSHFHMIASSKEIPLNDIIRDLKKFVSKELIKAIKEDGESRREWLLNKFSYAANRIKRGANYKVWQDGFHPIELSTNAMMDQKLAYIHDNPVLEAYVTQPEHWLYSSASFYFEDLHSSVNLTRLE